MDTLLLTEHLIRQYMSELTANGIGEISKVIDPPIIEDASKDDDLGSNLNQPLFRPPSSSSASAIPDPSLSEVDELQDSLPAVEGSSEAAATSEIAISSVANGVESEAGPAASTSKLPDPLSNRSPQPTPIATTSVSPRRLNAALTSKSANPVATPVASNTAADEDADSSELDELSDAEAAAPVSKIRYTVERKNTKNTKDNRHVIRLSLGYSDGSKNRWPSTVKSGAGYRRVAVGEAKDIDYKSKLGDNLALLLGEASEFETIHLVCNSELISALLISESSKEYWRLAAFPEEYGLFVESGASGRTDTYFFGMFPRIFPSCIA
jgi:hypothetical protein